MERFLKITIISLFSIILLITLISFATGNAKLGYGLRKENLSKLNDAFQNENLYETQYALFDLGQLRSKTKPEKDGERSSIVVLKIKLEYAKDNKDLLEEMVAKNQALKTTFLQYFSQHTQREIFLDGEEKTKSNLLSKLNSLIVLGKINKIYFEEYQFFN